MTDEVDTAQDAELQDTERAIAAVREAAKIIPAGEPGNCDLCGEWWGRLVNGVCCHCRDRYKIGE